GDLGFVAAAAPNTKTRNPLNLSPAIVASNINGRVFGGLAGSGSSDKKVVMTKLLQAMLQADIDLRAEIDAPRAMLSVNLDKVLLEDETQAGNLKNIGYDVKVGQTKGQINGFFCSTGLPQRSAKIPAECAVYADPRGNGLSVTSE
ncbi:MAG: hypothetical protein R3261_06145, partial [Alphaproteobacteria bacterium]|nr:hypothetical protein [Alphaproteobacteria bacterium]